MKLNCEGIELFTEDEVWTMLSDEFLPKRLQDFHKPLPDTLKEMQTDEEAKAEKWKGLPPNGPNEAFQESELFEFEVKESEPRFMPEYKQGESNLLYAGQKFYSLFRHLHCLYERLKVAHDFVGQAFEQELERRPEINTSFGPFIKENVEEIRKERYKGIFYPSTISYILGEIGAEAYEDLCKWLVGSRAYILFTIDKLIRFVSFFTLTVDREAAATYFERRLHGGTPPPFPHAAVKAVHGGAVLPALLAAAATALPRARSFHLPLPVPPQERHGGPLLRAAGRRAGRRRVPLQERMHKADVEEGQGK